MILFHNYILFFVFTCDKICKIDLIQQIFLFYFFTVFHLDRQQNIKGKEVTPYILERVNQLTEGKSLQASKSSQTQGK